MRIILLIFIVLAGFQTVQAQPYADLWPGHEIDVKTCFTNDRVVELNGGALHATVAVTPAPAGKKGYFCFMGALGAGYIGVFTVKVAAEAERFLAGAFEVIDDPDGSSYLGRRLLEDRLVSDSQARRGRMLVISPDHSKARRFALVAGDTSTRHGRMVVSFHAVNPIWEGMMAGGQTLLIEGMSRQFAEDIGATGVQGEMVAALAQLAINGVMSDNSEDGADFIISGVAGAAPHLSKYIPSMGAAWMAQTYQNIKQGIYRGFDRRYRRDVQ